MSARPAEILLVEDNPGDVELMKEALRSSQGRVQVRSVGNGLEALAFLRSESPFEGAPRPDLVILDLNLPQMDGREVLAEVKKDPSLRRIPVVILTSSGAERDVTNSYDLHANCYLIKPVGLKDFLNVVAMIESFWLAAVRLPSRAEGA